MCKIVNLNSTERKEKHSVAKRPPAEKWLYLGFSCCRYEAVCESVCLTIKGKWSKMSKVRSTEKRQRENKRMLQTEGPSVDKMGDSYTHS